ncbi:hypothetical protein ACFZDG_33900 [Kitasatospora xanthocidica]|uniref:hypothetical protein n=1 Tax=Kitasatospora xanthocidica TaxID=83382 RepID=UPI0036ED1DFB
MTSQHRGQHRDLVGGALKALVVSGHIAVLALFGLLVEQQNEHHGLAAAAAAPPADHS